MTKNDVAAPDLRSWQQKKKKIADWVIDEFKKMMGEGVLKTGDKLPSQVEFAKKLGVSRLSLREALNRLTVMGVIRQKPGVGTVVISGNIDLWDEKPRSPLMSDVSAMFELLEARRLIEGDIASLVTDRIEAEQLRLLEEDVREMRNALKGNDIDRYYRRDLAFHLRIANSCNNRYLVHMYATIQSLMEQFMKEIFEIIPELVQRSFDFHIKIMESIQRNDRGKAARNMSEHINDIETSLRRYYAEHSML